MSFQDSQVEDVEKSLEDECLAFLEQVIELISEDSEHEGVEEHISPNHGAASSLGQRRTIRLSADGQEDFEKDVQDAAKAESPLVDPNSETSNNCSQVDGSREDRTDTSSMGNGRGDPQMGLHRPRLTSTPKPFHFPRPSIRQVGEGVAPPMGVSSHSEKAHLLPGHSQLNHRQGRDQQDAPLRARHSMNGGDGRSRAKGWRCTTGVVCGGASVDPRQASLVRHCSVRFPAGPGQDGARLEALTRLGLLQRDGSGGNLHNTRSPARHPHPKARTSAPNILTETTVLQTPRMRADGAVVGVIDGDQNYERDPGRSAGVRVLFSPQDPRVEEQKEALKRLGLLNS
uniref:uncharacterized protein n=1 Tax=Myxine glutinosa TaxID=7769 RepID=UPI00358F5667